MDINPETGKPILNETLEKLKLYLEQKSSDRELLHSYLEIIERECKKSIPHRVLAAKYDGHTHILQVLDMHLSDTADATKYIQTIGGCLKTLNCLYNKQPDILDANALSLSKRLLDTYADNEQIISLNLQWLQKCCIMHEINRQNIMAAGIVQHVKPYVSKSSEKILGDVLAIYRYLVLDDDIRVEFGCAHEHARLIASEIVVDLVNLLAEIEDANLIADLLLTIGTLIVRQEFCTTVDEAGGIKLVLQAMVK